jgi:hypothetical protein
MQVVRVSVFLLLAIGFLCRGSDFPPQMPPELQTNSTFQKLMFVPPAYQKEALRLMIADANRTARQLDLPEKLPINRASLVGFYVSPPRLSQFTKTIGTISTSNYLYAPFAGRGFVVVRRDLEQKEMRLQAEYLSPANQMDTNAAYQEAAQILWKADIAVNVLNRDCRVSVMTSVLEGQTNRFVPIYWVTWSEKSDGHLPSGASVELFEPTKMILQLQVLGSQYILRKPLMITNLDFHLSPTNTPAQTNAPPVKQ